MSEVRAISPLPASASRLTGLDGLRGIAVLAVIGYHLNIDVLLPGGYLGVDIFFVISGFIITALLLRRLDGQGGIDFATFYRRRAQRLLPPSLALMAVLALLVPWLMPGAAARLRQDLPAALLQVLNWQQVMIEHSYFDSIDHPPLLQHLWSLAVEWQYYLVWPLALLALARIGGRRAVAWGAALIALASTGLMAWLYTTEIDGADPSRVYLGTDTHLMGLLAGSWLAALWNPWQTPARTAADSTAHGRPTRLSQAASLIALAVLVALMCVVNAGMAWMYYGGFLLVALLTCIVVQASTREATLVSRWLSKQPLQWLGSRSYSLYLWHWPVVVALTPGSHASAAEVQVLTLARLLATGLCAELSYRLLEAPLRRGIPGAPGAQPRSGLRGGPWSRVALGALLAAGAGSMAWKETRDRDAIASAPPAHPLPTSAQVRNPVTAALQVTAYSPAPSAQDTGTASPAAITVIGDSVMLGASDYLTRRIPGLVVDAQVGRQGSASTRLVQQLREAGRLGDAVVVHLGTNGYLSEASLRTMLGLLADRQRVVLVNVFADRRWTGSNNALIAQVARDYGNTRLLDWHALGHAHPEYFVRDGIHLSSLGVQGIHRALNQALGRAMDDEAPAAPVAEVAGRQQP